MKDSLKNTEIIRSGRKTIAIEITRDLRMLIRAPFGVSYCHIQRFVEEKSSWIEKHMALMKRKAEIVEQQKETATKLTAEEIYQLMDRAFAVIPKRVAYYAPIIGIHFSKITMRHHLSRWGSCSNKGNLSFNCLVMLTPPDVIDYVVVHELCHLKELNHSTRFWSEVSRILPNYKAPKKWLKENGSMLIQRVR